MNIIVNVCLSIIFCKNDGGDLSIRRELKALILLNFALISVFI